MAGPQTKFVISPLLVNDGRLASLPRANTGGRRPADALTVNDRSKKDPASSAIATGPPANQELHPLVLATNAAGRLRSGKRSPANREHASLSFSYE